MKSNRTPLAAGKEPYVPGFTLIELLVVIAIIGILASMLLPTLSRGKEKARMTQCLNNIHQIGVAVKFYVDDNKGTFPLSYAIEPDPPYKGKTTQPCLGGNDPAPDVLECFPTATARPLYSYLDPSEVFRCPADNMISWPPVVGGTIRAALCHPRRQISESMPRCWLASISRGDKQNPRRSAFIAHRDQQPQPQERGI